MNSTVFENESKRFWNYDATKPSSKYHIHATSEFSFFNITSHNQTMNVEREKKTRFWINRMFKCKTRRKTKYTKYQHFVKIPVLLLVAVEEFSHDSTKFRWKWRKEQKKNLNYSWSKNQIFTYIWRRWFTHSIIDWENFAENPPKKKWND